MADEGQTTCSTPSGLTCYAIRLTPGTDITSSLLKFVQDNNLKAAFVMTCVGSVTRATLRMAHATSENRNEIKELEDKHEIVSLVGTLSGDVGHLHASLSDKHGNVIGGHVIGNMTVFTTAEVVIGECSNLMFTRPFDVKTGFSELEVQKRS